MDSSVASQSGNAPPGPSGLESQGDNGRAVVWNANTTNPYMDKGVGVYEADLGKYCASNGARYVKSLCPSPSLLGIFSEDATLITSPRIALLFKNNFAAHINHYHSTSRRQQ